MQKKFLIFILFFSIFINLDITFADEIYDNFTPNNYVSCGGGYLKEIPENVPKITSLVYSLFHVLVPIVLVFMGSMDLLKGMTKEKEDEMKKTTSLFVKRLIYAAIIFFVFVIVKFVIGVVANESSSSILRCTECFIDNNCNN